MKDKEHAKKKIIVNAITSLRLLATIAIAPIYFSFGGIAAGLTVAGFMLTDWVDGKLARKWNVQTFLGSILDSSTDKSLAIVSLLTLSTINPLFLVPVGLELAILGTNYLVFKNGGNVHANILGKIKAWPLGAGITLGFLASDPAKLHSLTKVVSESAAPTLMTTATMLPTIACGATLVSYCYSLYQACKNDQKTLEDIQKERENLLLQKKSLQEIMDNLVDTDFYLEHKDEQLLKLFYKKTEQQPKM